MKSFRADYVFPVNADPIKNGVVTVDDNGKILSVSAQPQADTPIEQLSGVICPGFVNTHCHVELSHLYQKTAKGTGLIDFIKAIQQLRAGDDTVITEAATRADQQMHDNGIVAVGDISNSISSLSIKNNSKLYYHTFIEMFSFLPERADETFQKAIELQKEFKPLATSLTPHAPYSVSKDLFKLLKQYTDANENIISMHNQECEDENKFYRYKNGKFLELYQSFSLDISYFKPQARNSIQSVIPLISSKQPVLLVHNTCTNLKDIYFVKRFDRKINWCFCPNANLYIEGRLPKVDLFVDEGFNITLGTDSLASNDKLCILSEMRTIQEHFPAISTAKLLEWATINGAKFLGISDEYGSLEVGKKPGLNLLTGLDGLKITPDTRVKRLL